jgi:hypothetical protein
MRAVLVHGINVTESAYAAHFREFEKRWRQSFPELTLAPCFWGHLGARLHAGGKSIPNYTATGGIAETDPLAYWEILSIDPYFVLRFATLPPEEDQGVSFASPTFDAHVKAAISKLGAAFPDHEGELASLLTAAAVDVVASSPYRDMLSLAGLETRDFGAAVAKTIIAIARRQAAVMLARDRFASPDSWIACRHLQQDKACETLSSRLADLIRARTLGVSDWIVSGVARFANRRAANERGAFIDQGLRLLDTLVYQGSGDTIRSTVLQVLCQSNEETVLIAHSLGSVACFELLVSETLPHIGRLITVGSPIGFLYEINCLRHFPFETKLPERFPRWLNIYDSRDYVSSLVQPFFPEVARDAIVESRQDFPVSHSAYWELPSFWETVSKEVKSE